MKNKKIIRKILRGIIKSITATAAFTLLLSICAIDSPSFIPHITALISLSWIGFYAWLTGNLEF